MPYFSLWELKHYEMKVVEEYRWAITEATGRYAADEKAPVCCSLEFNWNTLYKHIRLTLRILNSGPQKS